MFLMLLTIFIRGFSQKYVVLSEYWKYSCVCGTAVSDIVLKFQITTRTILCYQLIGNILSLFGACDPPSRFGDTMAAYPTLFFGLRGMKFKRVWILRMDNSPRKDAKNMYCFVFYEAPNPHTYGTSVIPI